MGGWLPGAHDEGALGVPLALARRLRAQGAPARERPHGRFEVTEGDVARGRLVAGGGLEQVLADEGEPVARLLRDVQLAQPRRLERLQVVLDRGGLRLVRETLPERAARHDAAR